MTLQELTTFDRVFLDYLDRNNHDEDARDLYLTTMETNTTHLEVWNKELPSNLLVKLVIAQK